MKITYVMTVLATVCVAFAQAETLLDAPGDVAIGNRQFRSWKFRAARPGESVSVEFRHFVNFNSPAGWCPCWQIEVNGELLTAAASRQAPRLLNHPFARRHAYCGTFHADNRSDKWFSLYLPDAHAADQAFVPPDTDAMKVVLDLTDVVREDGENELKLYVGGLSERYYAMKGATNRQVAVIFSELKVRAGEFDSRLVRRPRTAVTRAHMRDVPLPKFTFLRNDGVLAIGMAGRRVPLVSRFSVPGGTWAEMTTNMTLETPAYRVTRRIRRLPQRIDFFDTFASKASEVIGVKVSYSTPLADFERVFVAGDDSPCAEEFEGGRNPSVFAAFPEADAGLAFLAQDDVFRVQNVQFCKDGAFGIRSDMLALLPGEPRTVEWSVYPVASADYYDFINTVRRDWDVNFRIDGTMHLSMNCYADCKPTSPTNWVNCMGISMNTFGCHFWNHIGGEYAKWRDNIWGLGRNAPAVRASYAPNEWKVVSPEPMNRFEEKCVARCRELTPEVKILSYVHNQISSQADDDRFDANRMIARNGQKMWYNSSPTAKLFVPTAGSPIAKAFLDLVDWNIERFGLDGIYHDELNYCNSRFYYGTNLWDRATVELDANFNVKRRISCVPLLKLDFTLAVFDRVLNHHKKILVGNFSPETRSERKYRFPRFEETYFARWVALSHLYTPVELGDMLTSTHTPAGMAEDQRKALKRGALYYHYLGDTGCRSITSFMFPFTPIEIHGGWLVGKERILTAVSGEFGWPDESPEVNLHVFDGKGREVPNFPMTVSQRGATRVFGLELPADHCAAIVRK